MQRQGDGGRERPAELGSGHPAELTGVADHNGTGHDDGPNRVAPEGDGQGTDRRGAQRGGDERPGRGHTQHPYGRK